MTVPEKYLPLIDSWKRHHPDWEYRFWTDEQLRNFVAETYPAFLERFDSYQDPISRVDAGRYLLLKHFGGLYVDLDMDCLRPLDDLLANAGFVVGREPEAHLQEKPIIKSGVTTLLCPSVIACTPGHPFWDHVIARLEAASLEGEVLDVTGPILLSKAYESYQDKDQIELLSSDVFYPLTKRDCWTGAGFNLEFWEQKTGNAYALHYWDGSWFRHDHRLFPVMPAEIQCRVVTGTGEPRPSAFLGIEGDPLVSCLMVTANRYDMARVALSSFLRQTYENRELIVLDDSEDGRFVAYLEALADPRIRILRPEPGLRLGMLRNMAVAAARGTYICQWDDDDQSDPERIRAMMKVLKESGANAIMLSRVLIWMPAQQRLQISQQRSWEGTMICEKAIMVPFPDMKAGEDTKVVNAICARYRVAYLDMPRLYLYCFHGRNTWTSDHFEAFWQRSTARFTGPRYQAIRQELMKRFSIAEYEAIVIREEAATTDVTAIGSQRPFGINVYGHLGQNFGLGAAGRGTVAAVSALRVPYRAVDLDEAAGRKRRGLHFDPDREAPFSVNIVFTNPDQLQKVFASQFDTGLDQQLFEGRYNIGYWAWESATTLPDVWHKWLSRFDEIWAPSNYAAQCLSQQLGVPVHVVPLVVQMRLTGLLRQHMGLPEGRFIFLTMFDDMSGFERKNPLGVIDAYRKAFPQDDGTTMLLIKSRHLVSENLERLKAAMAGRDDIHLRVVDVPLERLSGFYKNCDALVSLHRSEGFGLTIAEAMEQGTPVIATGFSGNLDFTTPDNSYLVPYELTRVDSALRNYPEGTEWAEPDIDAAAQMMREIVEAPAIAHARGEKGAALIHRNYNPLAVSRVMEERFRMLNETGKIRFHLPGAEEKISAPAEEIVVGAGTDHATGHQETVLILTPVKNGARHLARYFELLESLDYDPSLVSLGFLVSDSDDGSFEALERRLPELRARFHRVDLMRHDFAFQPETPRWHVSLQRSRREVLARSRNRLLMACLEAEDWVLWLDVDLVAYPSDIIQQLKSSGKDIVVPCCVRPDGRDYDLNSFRFARDRAASEDPDDIIDGIYQPARGKGRIYLSEMADEPLVEIDSVGGTALLIRANLHREGLNFPPYAYDGYIETEGLAMMAREMGHRCWAMPKLRIVHSEK